MAVVETRTNIWEVLAGRNPGQPVGPADPGVWAAVTERLNPARARPVLRPGIESVELMSVRGVPYVMLKSPETRGGGCYLRLSPEEWQLAQLMDGTRTVARLVAEFTRITGRLAPDQVTRIVADLAGNRMLAELPVDALSGLDRVRRRPWPLRLGRGLLAAAQGRRVVLANIDPLVGFLYRCGGRLLFTRVAALLLTALSVAGLVLFGWTWWRGDQSVFLTNGSYAVGAAVLLGLNAVALACHELGHALATKHAGRRVPAAGFLIYFGIPSVFVDTTDVWMAGRRARLLTTSSGPAAGLILAGLAQVVGFVVPEAAPWAFKLSFAWYLNALFNLNPFLALDGYYLLMDWLEVPNLRARGLAYVVARLRRRPPRWSQLDREGRLVALYGMLAVLWLVVAVNLGWRIWTDRVAGVVTGLWRAGWPARLLLAAVIAGLAAPLVYVSCGWLARRVRAVWVRVGERRHRADEPRRLDALRRSPLGRLPAPALAELASRARWLRPRSGEQLVFAGAAQPYVYVVVDGAVEARAPGDPAGTVRQRLGAGGLIGLADALTGAPAALAWHTAGTTLLALPASAVVSAVGPLPGLPPADRAGAEELFAQTPALQAMTAEERLGLSCAARSAWLPPDTPVVLSGADDAVVVEAGVVALSDGTELRRGTMIGPVGEAGSGTVGLARTPVRLWRLPAVSGLPLLFGAASVTMPVLGAAPGRSPVVGVHPVASYPPLAVPPGPPPSGMQDRGDIDRKFERKLWWLVLLLLIFVLLISGSNLMPGPAWAEMPGEKALLRAEWGQVVVTIGGQPHTLQQDDQVYVGEGDQIRVERRAAGRLTFRGGATTVLCAGTRTDIGPLWSDGARPVAPRGTLSLHAGRILAETTSTSTAFEPLALTVVGSGHTVVNRGAATYAVTSGRAEVSTGDVRVNGVAQPETGAPVECGAGQAAPDPVTPSELPLPDDSLTPSPSPTPSPTPSATVSPTGPSAPPTRTTPPPTSAPAPPPTSSQPPSNAPPMIVWDQNQGGHIVKPTLVRLCTGPTVVYYSAKVTDDRDSAETLEVTLTWSGAVTGGMTMNPDGDYFYGQVGPFTEAQYQGVAGTINVRITARDRDGGTATLPGASVTLGPC